MRRSLAASRLLLALAACVAAVACKDKQAAAPPTASAPTAPSTPPPAPRTDAGPAARPSLPTPLPPPAGTPISIEDAKKVLPPITAKEILALKTTSDGRQVHGTWCMDGDGADDVAKQLGKLMADAGYTALSIRGDVKKSGVQGDKDGYRLSMIVGGSTAATCPAPKHYFASATIFRL